MASDYRALGRGRRPRALSCERGLFIHPENKGRFYHDGRFATLMDVVNSYNTSFNLRLTAQEESDLVEYLKSL
jgi:hypothetical protein